MFNFQTINNLLKLSFIVVFEVLSHYSDSRAENTQETKVWDKKYKLYSQSS